MFTQKRPSRQPLQNSIKSSRSLNCKNVINSHSRSPNIISSFLKQRWNTKENNASGDTQQTWNTIKSNNTSYGNHIDNLMIQNKKLLKSEHLTSMDTNYKSPNNYNSNGRLFQQQLQFDNNKESMNMEVSFKKHSTSFTKELIEVRQQPKKQLSSVFQMNLSQYLMQNKNKMQSNEQQVPLQTNLDLFGSVLEGQKSVNNVTMDQIRIECTLGSGSYATVKLGKHIQTNQKFALKIYEKQKMQDPQKLQIIKKEISILETLNHPQIIKLFSVVEDQKNVQILKMFLDYSYHGSYIKTKFRMPEKEAKQIFLQLMTSIQYLHQKLIAHRDIKMDNILMQSNNRIKLIDFGFATMIKYGQKSTVYCGTPNYMSPEMIQQIPHNPQTSDIWSCGILFYNLLCGEHPFKSINNKELSKKIQNEAFKIPDGLQLSGGAIRILKACLEKNSEKRWSADRIIKDIWFCQ